MRVKILFFLFFCSVVKLVVDGRVVSFGNPKARKYVPAKFVGESDILQLVDRDAAIADKTKFIEEHAQDTNRVMLITRPRQFGKTFILRLLQRFYDIRGNSTELFKGLYVDKRQLFCKKHQNKHPIIYFSFASLTNRTAGAVFEEMERKIAKLYLEHKYLITEKPPSGKAIDPSSRGIFYSVINRTADAETYQMSLKFLTELVYNHHQKLVILLIDGYDTPILQGYFGNFYNLILKFVWSIIDSVKDKSFVRWSIITGFSQVVDGISRPNLKHYSVSHEKYSSYFGLTEDEVEELLKIYQPSSGLTADMLEKKYGGFTIGNQSLFNPRSVYECVTREPYRFRDNWLHYADRHVFNSFLGSGGILPIFEAQRLVDGKPIQHEFYQTLILPDVTKNCSFYWTLATHLGYLTFADKGMGSAGIGEDIACSLRIPNLEMRHIFKKGVYKYFNENRLPNRNDFVSSLTFKNMSHIQFCLQTYINNSAVSFYLGNVPDEIYRLQCFMNITLQGLAKYYGNVDSRIEDRILMYNLTSSSVDTPHLFFRIKEIGALGQCWIVFCRTFLAGFYKSMRVNTSCTNFKVSVKFEISSVFHRV